MPNQTPSASSPLARRRMQNTPIRNTPGELALRRELHARGLRYRVDVRPIPTLRRRADIVFTRAKVAVFCDGCFWHGCPEHASWPKSNADWWREKIQTTKARDRDTNAKLETAGWAVIRVWDHEETAKAADRVLALVERRLASI